ncbi:hypothetical protein Lal_00023908 [Lupinus albus]|nr:hypothetical protein Lal_00023908 [Lupinus albus]
MAEGKFICVFGGEDLEWIQTLSNSNECCKTAVVLFAEESVSIQMAEKAEIAVFKTYGGSNSLKEIATVTRATFVT